MSDNVGWRAQENLNPLLVNQNHHRIAGVDPIARVHIAPRDHAIKRGTHTVAVELGARFADRSLESRTFRGHPRRLGTCLFDLGARHDIGPGPAYASCISRRLFGSNLAGFGRRTRRLQACCRKRAVDVDQKRAFLDPIANARANALDFARRASRQLGALQRTYVTQE